MRCKRTEAFLWTLVCTEIYQLALSKSLTTIKFIKTHLLFIFNCL